MTAPSPTSDPAGAVAAALAHFRDPRGQGRPGSNFGLERIRGAMAALGQPQDRMGPAIHLTGTNGKGSTSAFIRAMAEAAGMKVHVFTSPHLVRVNERIRVASRLVEDDILADALERVAAAYSDLTYFEALTAAAFDLFARVPADLCVIEVGAGGALDSTNVMTRPVATVVTPISRDHEAMFGVSGVEAIARTKSGIFRPGVPAIVGPQSDGPLAVLREEAARIGAPVLVSGEAWFSGWEDGAFVYRSPTREVRAPRLGLAGVHQAMNAGAACAALEAWGHPDIGPAQAAAGLGACVWPARMQRLQPGPLTAAAGCPVWIDGAHNPAGAQVLARAVTDMCASVGATLPVLVFAIQSVKDSSGVLEALATTGAGIITLPLPSTGQEGGAGASPEELAASARSLGMTAQAASGLDDAMASARARGADAVFVCGSLYLCGAALAANGETIA